MSEELISNKFSTKTQFLWHSTQIYCLAFDRKGKYIFTGGDDGVLQIYSIAKDKRIKTLTDESSDGYNTSLEEVCRKIDFSSDRVSIESQLEKYAICDIAVNHENTLVSAAKQNGSILVWNLQTFELVAQFQEQSHPIRSVLFSPAIFGDKKYLISTSEDGFIYFFVYNYKTLVFEPKSVHRKSRYENERAVNIMIDTTPGGLLIGLIHTFGLRQEISGPKSKKETPSKSEIQSAIRIFSVCEETGLKQEWKSTYHKSHSDCVYSIRFAHNSFRFASACDKDTNAFIWTFDKANKKWDSIIIGINAKKGAQKLLRGKSKQSTEESLFVDEIIFSCDDKYCITTLTDESIKVWNSESGEVIQHFERYHKRKISVIESHPTCGHIFLSAGYDSKIFIFDIIKGSVLMQFDCSLKTPPIDGNDVSDPSNDINPLLLQCSFSPDGHTIAATDNFGNLTVFTMESQKETNYLDQLEMALFVMETGSTASDEDISPEEGITPSEDNSKFIQSMFDYETDLLRGIEKPSPTKLIQSSDDKKNVGKAVKKLDLEPDSTVTQTNSIKSSPVLTPKLRSSPVPTTKLRSSAINRKGKASPVPDSKAKPTPDSMRKFKNTKFKTPLKKSIEKTPQKETDDKPIETIEKETEKTPKTSKSKTTPGSKQTKYSRTAFKSILDEIFDNPNSRPFQINDEILYPTFRREIVDADLSLTSIREEMLLNSRYTFQRFNKEMNKVLENAKTFYKHNDEEVYGMAIELEKFYCSKMETFFGSTFKPPLSCDSSDEQNDESSGDMTSQKKSIPKPIDNELKEKVSKTDGKQTEDIEDNAEVSSTTDIVDKIDLNSSPSKSKREESVKQTPKQSKPKEKIESNRKRTTDSGKSGSDSEPVPEKKPKADQTSDEVTLDSTVVQTSGNNQKNNELSDDMTDKSEPELIIDCGNSDDVIDFEALDNEVSPPIEKPVPETSGVANGSTTQTNSCDNSTQMKNCLFCIFCDKIFWSISEAKTHYILHLCPLKCTKCDQLFTTYDNYLSHSCDDPKLPENIELCRQYSDSINWIEKFIDYQQSDDIESFEAVFNQNKKCIVCEKVEKFRPQSSRKAKEAKRVDHSSHLEKHLKYVPQFQCLICLLNCDKYFYCKNSGEAEQHLIKEHTSYRTIHSNALHFFDGSVPKLDEIIVKFYS